MPRGLTIREATPADQGILAELYLVTRRATFSWVEASDFQLEDFARDCEGELILVAEVAGEVAGFASLWIADNFLHNFFIAKHFQGCGIGKRLLAAALKRIGRPARLKCAIGNKRACGFYEALGWEIESTSPDGPTGPYRTYVLEGE